MKGNKIFFYNSFLKKKEEFKTQKKDHIKLYSCGPTVYDSMHLGNARIYSYWDSLVRFLRWKNYKVKWVQNFTDVGHLTDDADSGEDKVTKKAKEKKLTPKQVSEYYIEEFFEDIKDLNIAKSDLYTKATDYINEMIEFNKVLISKGFAYESDGNIYFDSSKFKDYENYLVMKQNLAGARIPVNEGKKNPNDFALWIKAQKNHLLKWKSPWSLGYPGWHLECSVMSLKHLGPTLDIHAGGYDHLMLHHPNEIAQSEAYSGKTFSNYWLHAHFLTLNGDKMSKSKKNYITVRQGIKKYGGQVLRTFLIGSHYRTQIDFNKQSVGSSKDKYEKLIGRSLNVFKTKIYETNSSKNEILILKNDNIKNFEKCFDLALSDDFNTAKALSVLLEFRKKINSLTVSSKDYKMAIKKLKELMNILGLIFEELKFEKLKEIKNLRSWGLVKKEILKHLSKDLENKPLTKEIKDLINESGFIRFKAKKNEDYVLSDDIRSFLKIKLNTLIEDINNGFKIQFMK